MNIDNPLVTVIIPLYNSARYLRQNIESVLAQTHSNLELILVDDESPDDSGTIADEYAQRDQRVTVIHQPNAGVSNARNAALNIAKGDWVCFIDGDDYVLPEYLEYMLKLAIDADAEVAVAAEIYKIYENAELTAAPTEELYPTEVLSAEQATERLLLYRWPIGPWSKLFKRSLIDEYGIQFIPGMFNGDGFNFNAAMFQRAKRVAVGYQKVYVYRRDIPDSGSVELKFSHVKSSLWGGDQIIEDVFLATPRVERAAVAGRWLTAVGCLGKVQAGHMINDHPDTYLRLKQIIRHDAPNIWKVPFGLRYNVMAVLAILSPALISRVYHWYMYRFPLTKIRGKA